MSIENKYKACINTESFILELHTVFSYNLENYLEYWF